MHIILCGMPMCGKTYFGEKIAHSLELPFVDTDALIETAYGKSCRALALEVGDKNFRLLEKEALDALKTLEPSVVATGGGILCFEGNGDLLKSMGTIIYLKTDVSVLWERLLKKNELPAYIDTGRPQESLEALAKQRMPIYEQYCDVIIDTQCATTEEVLWQVINWVRSSG